MIERMRLAAVGSGIKVAIIMLDAEPRLAGAYAMDAKQSDAAAGGGGIRSSVSVRARGLGKPYGRGADRGSDRPGCA